MSVNPLNDLPFDCNALISYDEFNWDCVEGMDAIHKSTMKAYESLVKQMALTIATIVDRILLIERRVYSSAESIARLQDDNLRTISEQLTSRAAAMTTMLEDEYGNSTLPMGTYIIYRQLDDGFWYPNVEQATSMPVGREAYGPFPSVEIAQQLAQNPYVAPVRDTPLAHGLPELQRELLDQADLIRSQNASTIQPIDPVGSSDSSRQTYSESSSGNRAGNPTDIGVDNRTPLYNPDDPTYVPQWESGQQRDSERYQDQSTGATNSGDSPDSRQRNSIGARAYDIPSESDSTGTDSGSYQPESTSELAAKNSQYEPDGMLGLTDEELKESRKKFVERGNKEFERHIPCEVDLQDMIQALSNCCSKLVNAIKSIKIDPPVINRVTMPDGTEQDILSSKSENELEYIIHRKGEQEMDQFLVDEGLEVDWSSAPTTLGMVKIALERHIDTKHNRPIADGEG